MTTPAIGKTGWGPLPVLGGMGGMGGGMAHHFAGWGTPSRTAAASFV